MTRYGVIGFSSFGVLVDYAIANAAAYTQPAHQRRWPRGFQILGLIGCLTLVVTLPLPSVVAFMKPKNEPSRTLPFWIGRNHQ